MMNVLQRALISLSQAIDEADWDTAVQYCSAAMRIPQEVLYSRFAASVVVSVHEVTEQSFLYLLGTFLQPTTELPEEPPETLLSLRKRILEIFVKAFKRATEQKQQADATRFFKLLPRVGWREEGLRVYSEFATDLVRDHGSGVTEALANRHGELHYLYRLVGC